MKRRPSLGRFETTGPLAKCANKRQKRKEVITMKYDKPEAVVLGLALSAVQNVNKQPIVYTDDSDLKFTSGAYEADE